MQAPISQPLGQNFQPLQQAPMQQPTAAPNNKKMYLIIAGLLSVVLIGGVSVMLLMKKDDSKPKATSQVSNSNSNNNNPVADNSSDTKKANDLQRKLNVNSIAIQLEVYYNDKLGYPTAKDLSNEKWVQKNFQNVEISKFKDPSGRMVGSPDSDLTYELKNDLDGASTSGCVSPTTISGSANAGTACEHFKITAKMETQENLVKNSLN